MRLLSIAAAIALLAAASSACASRGLADGELVDYDVTLDLRADGSTHVEERAHVRFDTDGLSAFALSIPRERVDAIEGLVATVDGAPAGDSGGELRGAPGGGLRWTGASRAAEVRVFTMAYDARGALAVRGARGVFIWPAVPGGSGSIARARVRLSWPQGSVPMQGPAVAAPGWDVVVRDGAAVMTARNVARAEPPAAYVDLVLDDLSVAEPIWQVNDLRARQLMPAFVSAGLFMVVVGAGVLVMVGIQYPVPRTARSGEVAPPAPVAAAEETAREIASLSAWRAPEAMLERLASSGLVDRERLAVARGLRLSGVVVFVAALVVAAAVRVLIGSLGAGPYAVPAGLLVSACLLFVRGVTFPVLTEAGARVGMLHSRRL
jgi:hypothetical protein